MEEHIAEIIAIITTEVEHGQALAGFHEKEKQLLRIFQSLSPADALTLKQRLKIARADDPLTIAFNRLVVERRDRLLEFLSDPARRVRPID